jgi:parvulin-like peptidyl-prolyl isomerase
MSKRVTAALLVGALAGSVPLGAEILEQVLVKVNGDIISKTEFEARQVAALRNRPELANATPSSVELQKAIAETTPDLILDAVDELLLVQRGRELGYALGDEQFNQILTNIRESNNLQDEARFQEALKQEGMTLADLRRQLERQMLVQQVQRADIVGKLSVTEDEARAYYDAHREEFTTPAEVTLREILIEVPATDKGVNVAQDEDARAQAEEVRKRLLAGEPFPRMAGDHSAAPSKANGGLIGPLLVRELSAPLQERLAQMKVGDITEVLRTQRGYQILKLESRTETRIRSFEDARSDIGDRVMDQKLEAERLKYLDRLRAQATIDWRNDELQKAYEQALERRRAASAPAEVSGPPRASREGGSAGRITSPS